MSHLRKQFEQETGKVADNCTGLGDYSGLQADSNINSEYIKWLEAKVALRSASDNIPQLAIALMDELLDLYENWDGKRDYSKLDELVEKWQRHRSATDKRA